ncbi:MAG: peptidylprolyl isomerase [Rhodocyclaceae bacterium]|nr:peptidylprolyl isomerase [Rhodocyclaceae bacterium]MDZ4215607.1 peptidylprolyl isomerase [Rhodocyclaceae bacterium]
MKKLFVLLSAICFALPAWSANPQVELKTNQGTIVLELDAEKAPKTTENFLQYVKDGHYNGTIFHRVIENFMIQGGGFEAGMKEKPTRAPIQNEAKNGLKNVTGSIAMARTPNPHSASAQFFINLKDNSFLDYPGQDGWGYAVFGKVVQGLDVVQKLAKVATGNAAGHQNVPTTPIVIESAKLIEKK